MSISLRTYTEFATKFVQSSYQLNTILETNQLKSIIKVINNSTKKNLYKNSLRIAIETFENNDMSYLNCLNDDQVYQACLEFSTKMDFSIVEKSDIINELDLQYGITDYIEILLTIKNLPENIKIELMKFINKETTLCLFCNSNMELLDCKDCYLESRDQVYCDFSKEMIKDRVLHCCKSKSVNHINGFDIGVEYIDTYFNDLMDKRLEKRINTTLLEDNYKMDEMDLRFIYSVVCSNMIPSTVIYYNSIYNDLQYIKTYPYINDEMSKTHLNHMERILCSGIRDWERETKRIIEINNTNTNNVLIHFKNKLSIDKNIYYTKKEKESSILNYRKELKTLLETLRTNIENIRNYTTVLFNIKKINYNSDITNIYNLCDTEVFIIYDLLETLEDSTPIENKIPINIIDSSNICQIETENCGICLENISLDTNGNIFQITDCKHLFHDYCLNKWLQINNSCPICRTNK